MKRRVVVTGLGLITPVGLSAESTWVSLVAGRGGVGYLQEFDTEGVGGEVAAEVNDFDQFL